MRTGPDKKFGSVLTIAEVGKGCGAVVHVLQVVVDGGPAAGRNKPHDSAHEYRRQVTPTHGAGACAPARGGENSQAAWSAVCLGAMHSAHVFGDAPMGAT